MLKNLMVIALLIAVLLPTAPGAILAQEGSGIVITPKNTEQVVELARLGRGKLTAITIDPNGDIGAAATSVGVWLYDLKTGKTLRLLESRTGAHAIAFAPERIICPSGEKTARLNSSVWPSKTWIKPPVLRSQTRIV